MCLLAFSHQCLHNFFFSQSHRLLISHANAEVTGENTPERKFDLIGDRTHNHQIMSPTGSPLSQTGRARCFAYESSLKKAYNQVVLNTYHRLTLSSIYTRFNTLKKKSLQKHCGKKVKFLKMSNFTFFHNVFYAICILESFYNHISIVVCSSLNLGQSQNGVLGNGLIQVRANNFTPYKSTIPLSVRCQRPNIV